MVQAHGDHAKRTVERNSAGCAMLFSMEALHVQARNECALHGAEGREPWGRPFRGIEVVRCDHLGGAYVVEMILLAGSEEQPQYSRHIHFVSMSDRQREVHVLGESLSQDDIDEVWAAMVAAMERGDRPRSTLAQFHAPG